MIKKEIILIENAMEESEMFLAKLMKEEKALIVRSNSTGEQVVKEAKEGNALSTAMEKLINDTAEERFGEHVKAVQEMSARMENMALQRINLRAHKLTPVFSFGDFKQAKFFLYNRMTNY